MAEALNVKLSTLVSGIETPINPATTAAQVSFGESNVDAELKALRALASGKGTMSVVDDIAARDELSPAEGDSCWVKDATADDTVTQGAALYIYADNQWVKMAEAESMDVIVQWAGIQGKPMASTTSIDAAAQFVSELTVTAQQLNELRNYTHPDSAVTPDTYRSVTVDQQGHVTAGSNPTIAVAEGGTGATDAAGAVTNLGFTRTAEEISASVGEAAKLDCAVLGAEDEVPETLREGGLIIRKTA